MNDIAPEPTKLIQTGPVLLGHGIGQSGADGSGGPNARGTGEL